jgi:hypothetical protein
MIAPPRSTRADILTSTAASPKGRTMSCSASGATAITATVATSSIRATPSSSTASAISPPTSRIPLLLPGWSKLGQDRRQHARGRATPPRLRREVLDASALCGRRRRPSFLSLGPSAAFDRVPAPARRAPSAVGILSGISSAVREAASREAPPSIPAPLGRPSWPWPASSGWSADGSRRRSRPGYPRCGRPIYRV